MIRFLSRNIKTVLKLPIAVAWDIASLGNMGEGTSTGKVLQEHQHQKDFDDAIDALEEIINLKE